MVKIYSLDWNVGTILYGYYFVSNWANKCNTYMSSNNCRQGNARVVFVKTIKKCRSHIGDIAGSTFC